MTETMTEPEPQPSTAAPSAFPIHLADAALAVRGAGVVAGRVRGVGDCGFRAGGGAGNLSSSSRIVVVDDAHLALVVLVPASVWLGC